MAIVQAGLVEQSEARAHGKQLQELFADHPDVDRIDHHFAEDWSGALSLFLAVVLASSRPGPSARTAWDSRMLKSSVKSKIPKTC